MAKICICDAFNKIQHGSPTVSSTYTMCLIHFLCFICDFVFIVFVAEFNVASDIVIELTQFFPLLSFRSSLKAVGVAHNALVGPVVIWLMIKDALKSPGAVKCSQCEHKYHEACLKEHTYQEVASNTWFCGESCQEVYSGLQSRIRIVNLLSDGLSWTLLRCIHGDQRDTFCLNGCCFEGRMQLKAGC